MSQRKVLVIDDSTTIRQLCAKELGDAGFQVLVAETADAGVEIAFAEHPEVIILDHQLPGKTGIDVATELLSNPGAAEIPIVVSSSLQSNAYEKYVDCTNVVGVLTKPYTPEALIAKVEYAMPAEVVVVQPQADESDVSQAIEDAEPIAASKQIDCDLTGTLRCFGLREVIDMLNNKSRKGMLTIECETSCVSVYIDRGRIQAVTASGIAPETVSSQMPASLVGLAPVINLTVTDKSGSEIDGLIGLVDSNAIDSRLVRKLLQLQAAILLRTCFIGQPIQFRFERDIAAPHLFHKLPLDASLLSILVEGALICDKNELPICDASKGFERKAIRGQSLDRAGLSSRHVKLMHVVSEPISASDIAVRLGWSEEEVIRVVHGFEMAELIKIVSFADRTEIEGPVANGEHAPGNDNSMDCVPEAVLEGSTQSVEG